ncbi:GPI-linked NAD(P)(+)--arginine ADP-ribosyltransferase 1 [Etheostoma cragini]|uniref:GPI-linked NAD(P)(+)--arginine ADP-ribosyltransferase 1 n=1 Tax=Etheostoma cragini TaxID=417921 RepID=UPI00155EBE18|nr:GPI-linked NAD(P)(+)--arginine ADP-ribosyltransferase 1 [Etheostoma cragini]XP_034746145.1 GPI-linked NAD(P)(+)--arginine ADP-ribosyltransferase 1 [Etheostoma cragini]
MWDRRKLLLAAIIFAALNYKLTSTKMLDMASDAVDDLYDGCRKEAMETFINLGLLEKELHGSEEFKKAWDANTQCSKPIPKGTKEHTAALLAYASDSHFAKTFDDAVETMGGNVSTYENHFHFKSLHFLLMDSMLLLNPKKDCKTVYVLQEGYTAQKGSKVRFGRFTKVQTNYQALRKFEDWDGQVLLSITSCIFVNLGDNICGEEKDMALLSPAEVFTVEAVNNIHDEINDAEYTEIVLKHSQQDSSHNCYSFSRSPADVPTLGLVLLLVAFSLFFHPAFLERSALVG